MKKLCLSFMAIIILLGCSNRQAPNPYQGVEEAMVMLPRGDKVKVVYNGVNRDDTNEKFYLFTRARTSTIWVTAPFWILYDTVGLGGLINSLKINPKDFTEEQLENVHKNYTYPKLQVAISKSQEIDPRFVTVVNMGLKPILLKYKSIGEDDYELTYAFDIYAHPLTSSGPFQCVKTQSGKTLKQWQEDNYKLVVEVSKTLADACIQDTMVYLTKY